MPLSARQLSITNATESIDSTTISEPEPTTTSLPPETTEQPPVENSTTEEPVSEPSSTQEPEETEGDMNSTTVMDPDETTSADTPPDTETTPPPETSTTEPQPEPSGSVTEEETSTTPGTTTTRDDPGNPGNTSLPPDETTPTPTPTPTGNTPTPTPSSSTRLTTATRTLTSTTVRTTLIPSTITTQRTRILTVTREPDSPEEEPEVEIVTTVDFTTITTSRPTSLTEEVQSTETYVGPVDGAELAGFKLSNGSSGLTGGQKAGIAVGASVVGLALLGALIYILLGRRKKRQSPPGFSGVVTATPNMSSTPPPSYPAISPAPAIGQFTRGTRRGSRMGSQGKGGVWEGETVIGSSTGKGSVGSAGEMYGYAPKNANGGGVSPVSPVSPPMGPMQGPQGPQQARVGAWERWGN